MIRWFVLFLLVTNWLYGETFSKTRMYVEQEHKLRLRKVEIKLQDDALVVKGTTKHYAGTVKRPYAEITEMEYERSKHRRWTTGILLSPLLLLSKGKEAVVCRALWRGGDSVSAQRVGLLKHFGSR